MYDIIYKKRLGFPLSKEEIDFFVDGYTRGEIPDYQASALLMAIMFQKMNLDETTWLTLAIAHSGDRIDLSAIPGVKVDKHSTGGVGDKTSLIVGPIVASLGVPVAKMSGRGLGYTGGTVDKMEAIPGMRTAMEPDEFIEQVREWGLALIGQTGHIAPADKKLYALRDVTATIDNLSLIAASIMGKKLAAGADCILLDVKCGPGAFRKTDPEAEALGQLMVSIGNQAGKRTVAVISDMSQPLGRAVGNAPEVAEAIETLHGKGPEDITLLSIYLAGMMAFLGGKAETPAHGEQLAEEALASGLALEKFKAFVAAQGGQAVVADHPERLPQPNHTYDIFAEKTGYVSHVDANIIGSASQQTGAGRLLMGDKLDLSAGVLLHKKIGDSVKSGDLLARIQGNDKTKLVNAKILVAKAFQIENQRTEPPVLIRETLGLQGEEPTKWE